MISHYRVVAAALLGVLHSIAQAGVADLYDGKSGVTCSAYNHETGVLWNNPGGDWVDEKGEPQGSIPFAILKVERGSQTVQVDVTKLIGAPGILLRHAPLSKRSLVSFHSRESAGLGPRLTLKLQDNRVLEIAAKADSSISLTSGKCSTQTGLGEGPLLSLLDFALISFGALPAGVVSAQLELNVAKATGPSTVALYALRSPFLPEALADTGFSAKYPGDAGIAGDPRVLYFESWDDRPEDWWKRSGSHTKNSPNRWTQDEGRFPDHWTGVFFDPRGGVIGAGLKLVIQSNENAGTIVPTADLMKLKGHEYEELFVRYYVKFGADFRDATACDGGKLPGFAADTTIAGNSGSRVSGVEGWSLRGAYLLNCDKKNPIYPKVIFSNYAYHAEMKGAFGDEWTWPRRGETGLAELERGHCVEQQVKVNAPGVKDGVLRTWVDGRLALEKTNVYLRAQPPYRVVGNLGIQKMWGTLHHGGRNPFGHAATLWYDQTVVATERIGCMAH
jgi:hypothetical protein